MGTIFNYLEDVQYDSIYDQPFTELDILFLTEITYLNYDTIVTDDLDLQKASRLTDVPQYMPQENSMMNTKHRLALLDQAAKVKRYKNIKLLGYVNDIDLDVQKQFAAMTYKIDLDTFVIAFRGTDDSIIGWQGHVPYDLYGTCPCPANCCTLRSKGHAGFSNSDLYLDRTFQRWQSSDLRWQPSGACLASKNFSNL